MSKQFTHLHLHTEYSMLDGATRISELFERCGKLGMKAVAITDHGNMYGVTEFMRQACNYTIKNTKYEEGKEPSNWLSFLKNKDNKFIVKPIIGCEVYVCPNMTSCVSVGGMQPKLNHLILLCKNKIGYKNLINIVSRAFTEGFYYKPRIDFSCLEGHSEGLIALSACIAGEVPQLLLANKEEEAIQVALKYKQLFGDDYYIEIQNHNISDQLKVLPRLASLAKKTGIKLVATNDVHYLKKEDAVTQRVLMSIATRGTLNDAELNASYSASANTISSAEISEDKYFPTNEFYLKNYDEMKDALNGYEEALEVTNEIADKCDCHFFTKEPLLPQYKTPDNIPSNEYLRSLTNEGLIRLYGNNGEITEEVRNRADFELNVIENMGFVDYFLIVWDFIHHSEKEGIPVGPGRGSGAGSIVAYALGITKIDPLKYNLLFERFLNPERVSNPDFDIDFCVDRRNEVVDYVRKIYGDSNVSQIITFGTMAAKLAIKDVGRVMNMSYSQTDKISKLIPSGTGKAKLGDLMGLNGKKPLVPELRKMYDTDEASRRVLDMACKIEGMPRQTGMHAAGVIICRSPIMEHVPLALSPEDAVVTQFNMNDDEALGLLKMDFLGLTTLTDIKKAADYVYETRNVKLDFYSKDFSYDDPEVYKLIGEGDTVAVFQLESAGMIKFMRSLKPDNLENIMAGISLFRPGPMDFIGDYTANKKNPESVKYMHPKLKPILESTYGVIVYQEQVMEIVRSLAGYSLGRADNVRRLMSKKKYAEMEAERPIFINGGADGTPIGCIKNGVSEEIANEVFNSLINFADYGFNKSHGAAYAYLTYQTAYLKRYYKEEYFAAVLNNRINKIDELTKYLTYLKECNITVLPPDVNHSRAEFTVERVNDKSLIRIGMSAVRNVGVPIINAIVAERNANGQYKTLTEFMRRQSDAKIGVNKRMMENLIYAGAFDCFGRTRSQLIAALPIIMDAENKQAAARGKGQTSFFDNIEVAPDFDYPDFVEMADDVKLRHEKEVTGVYLSGHPLANYAARLKDFKINTTSLNPLNDDHVEENSLITIAGLMSSCASRLTKKKTELGTAKLEDMYGSIELLSAGDSFAKLKPEWINDRPVVITGRVRYGDTSASVWVDTIKAWKIDDNGNIAKLRKVLVYFSISDKKKYAEVKSVVACNKGSDRLYIRNSDDNKSYLLSAEFGATDMALNELASIVGEDNVNYAEV